MDKKLLEIKDKYFIKLLLLGIANLSMLLTISNINSTCNFFTHQEKLP
ncbi:cyclic lactone autoinducer peptide [uncultured Tyzzerella sp.]|nr:cyclic lactone autoinducer peptide [uncultured Tyzzerella sp.]